MTLDSRCGARYPGVGDLAPRPDAARARGVPQVVALVAARDVASTIDAVLGELLTQTVPVALVVVAPYDCRDDSADRAASHPVVVHAASLGCREREEALALAWRRYGEQADAVLVLDGDAVPDRRCVESLLAGLYGDGASQVASMRPRRRGRRRIQLFRAGGDPGEVLRAHASSPRGGVQGARQGGAPLRGLLRTFGMSGAGGRW